MTAFIIAAILVIGIVAFWKVGVWGRFLIAFALLLGGFEGYSVLTSKLSMSQSFWAFIDAHPVYGWMLWGYLVVVMAVWLAHMIWPKIRRKS